METSAQPLISIKDLKVHFPLAGGSLFRRSRQVVKAVDGFRSTSIRERLWDLVGESGCGKSTLGRAILRLTDSTSARSYFKVTIWRTCQTRQCANSAGTYR